MQCCLPLYSFHISDKYKETYEKNFKTAYRQSVWGWPRNLTDTELDQLNNQIHSFYSQHLPKDTTPLCYKIDASVPII